jgi:hypothetical protein
VSPDPYFPLPEPEEPPPFPGKIEEVFTDDPDEVMPELLPDRSFEDAEEQERRRWRKR